MSEPARNKAQYQDLYSIPENMTGEIIDGDLTLTPKPSARHNNAAYMLNLSLGPSYRVQKEGPGGWIFLPEQEIMLGENILVPDVSGWRKERFPGVPDDNWISIPPDWVCEILSPGTERSDRVRKMPIYARHGVGYLWHINPFLKTLEVFKLESGRWAMLYAFAENDKVRAEPFHEIEIELGDFWMD